MINIEDLKGRWQLSRLIEDAHSGVTGRFEGVAQWTPQADGLLQTESGTLRYGQAAPMQATRRYLWRQDAHGVHVLFDDGRPFHTVPDEGQEALHDCPPDTYRVHYRFAGRDAFSTVWHVTGPRKDAVLRTQFTRAPL